MKRLLTLGLLLVAATVAMAQTHGSGGLRPGTQPGRFQDLTEDYTTGKRTVADAIPRVCVRYDDGDLDALVNNDIYQYVSRGIPVGLALNWYKLSQAAKDSIHSLMVTASSNGTSIEILQHSNMNMPLTTLYPGSATTGYDTLVAELSTDLLAAEFGQTPKVFVLPGDEKRQEWYGRNFEMVTGLLDSLGMKYGVVGGNRIHNDSTATLEMYPRRVATNDYTEMGTASEVRLSNNIGARPGSYPNPYLIPGPTWDIGNKVVERGTGNLSGTSVWTLLDPGNGNETNGANAKTYYYKPVWYQINQCLSNNLGFMVAAHDSTRNDATDPPVITGITGAELVGNWSPTHMAVILKALHDAGHIKLVTPTEWCEWTMGEYAVGVDLISNPGCLIPQFDIGDTIGSVAEYINPRGMSFAGANRSAMDATGNKQMPVAYYTGSWDQAPGSYAKYLRSGKDPDEYIGAAITGYMGYPGGIHFANGNNLQYLQIVIGGLQPGRYRFSFARTGGVAMTVNEMHFAAAQKAMLFESTWEAEGATVYADTVLSWRWKDLDVTIGSTGVATEWTTQAVDFMLPRYPPGDFNSLGNMYGDESGGTNILVNGGATDRNWIGDTQWAFTIQCDFVGPTTISHPKLIYLGPR